MLYRYRKLAAERPVVLVRVKAPFDMDRSLSTLAALEFPERPPGWRGLIWDIRRRTTYPELLEVQELVRHFNRWDRVAIVGSSDLQYGMARVASLLSDRIMAVRNLQDAVRWATGKPID